MKDIKTQLLSISPIDGRYRPQTFCLSPYFSESSLFQTRVEIEVKYLLFLSKIGICRKFTEKETTLLKNLYLNFDIEDAVKIKKLEQKTRHDVKAVEYFIRSMLKATSLKDIFVWIHFGLTSADINDNAYRLMMKRSLSEIVLPKLKSFCGLVKTIAMKYKELPMLARTHGQAAVPTTFGKEMMVFYGRLEKECNNLEKIVLYGKLNGAVGNWNALHFSYPKINWPKATESFLQDLGLKQSRYTTQIAPPEDIVYLLQNMLRINSILLDLNQDMWRYISDDWIVQKGKDVFVGSSTMPQKINPIEFENSEGNLIIANGLIEAVSRKLPLSRLQRDLSDSTVIRNIGVIFAHSFIAYESCNKGLSTILVNKQKMLDDLNNNWAILSEAIQTILRKNNNENAYEEIAQIVRGHNFQKNDYLKLINSLDLPNKDKIQLLNLAPENYIGYAKKIYKFHE